MPQIEVVFYKEDDGSVPVLDWFDGLTAKAQDKCRVRLERLKALGHELHRPHADYLQDGIYELRVGLQGINYRMLYFLPREDSRSSLPWACQERQGTAAGDKERHRAQGQV
ncbi:MAG: type II toxin-antitoxin system RelE/ParE family toxin [Phycisphaerae bacterium]